MDIEAIRSFLAVVRYGSISKAAHRLYLTQPAMSQRLRRLERGLGFELLTRDWTGVHLTREGTYFLPYAAQLMRDLSNASEVLADGEDDLPRSFHEVVHRQDKALIGIDSWLPARGINHVVATCIEALGVDGFTVIARPAATLIDLYELNQLDAALYYSAEEDPETEIVAREEMVLVHHSSLRPEPMSGPALTQVLAGRHFVLFDNPILTHHATITTELISRYGITQFHVVDDFRTLLALIHSDRCITVVPGSALADHLRETELDVATTQIPGLLREITIHLAVRRDGRTGPHAGALTDAARAAFLP